jgi:hypothetical protein
MAKASPALSTAEITSNPAITVAAAEFHTLINSKPQSPTKDELATIIAKAALPAPDASVPRLRAEWEALAAEIRAAMAQEDAAIAACGDLDAGPAFDKADALVDKCRDELRALVARLPNPPRTFADIALMAEIAFHYADHEVSGCMEELDDDDKFISSSARLIEAVLQFAEARHA